MKGPSSHGTLHQGFLERFMRRKVSDREPCPPADLPNRRASGSSIVEDIRTELFCNMLDRPSEPTRTPPKVIRIHPADNVAIVVDDLGLAAGTAVETGVRLVERIPQAHKVALSPLKKGDAVRRYDTVI